MILRNLTLTLALATFLASNLLEGQTNRSTYGTVTPGPITYVPPHDRSRGDRDFKGHGPRVSVNVSLSTVQVSGGRWELQARVSMSAVETRKDWTTARGTKSFTLYRSDKSIRLAGGPSTFSYGYTDRSHRTDTFHFHSGLVRRLSCVGDTKGNEAGTRTRCTIHFHPIQIWSGGGSAGSPRVRSTAPRHPAPTRVRSVPPRACPRTIPVRADRFGRPYVDVPGLGCLPACRDRCGRLYVMLPGRGPVYCMRNRFGHWFLEV